jgi:hypothetical protein
MSRAKQAFFRKNRRSGLHFIRPHHIVGDALVIEELRSDKTVGKRTHSAINKGLSSMGVDHNGFDLSEFFRMSLEDPQIKRPPIPARDNRIHLFGQRRDTIA